MAFLILLAYGPYSLFLDDQIPVSVAGVSLWASALPTVMLLTVLASLRGIGRLSRPWVYALLGAAAVLIVRVMAYDDPLFTTARGVRWLVLIPLTIHLARIVLRDRGVRSLAVRALVVNTLVAALLGLAYRFEFFRYRVLPDVDPSGLADVVVPIGLVTRASGFMGSPNIFGSFLVLGILLSAGVGHRAFTRHVALQTVLLAGIVTSGSRAAFLLGATITTIFVLRWTVANGYDVLVRMSILTAGVLASAGTLVAMATPVTDRLSQEGLGTKRWEKLQLFFDILDDHPVSVLIGANREDLFNPVTGVSVSDNSATLVVLLLGVPLLIAFARVLWTAVAVPGHMRSRSRTLTLAVLAAVLLVNNAVLWDLWWFNAIAVYWIIVYSSRTGSPESTRLAAPAPMAERPPRQVTLPGLR